LKILKNFKFLNASGQKTLLTKDLQKNLILNICLYFSVWSAVPLAVHLAEPVYEKHHLDNNNVLILHKKFETLN
jgi:hypothetical protein